MLGNELLFIAGILKSSATFPILSRDSDTDFYKAKKRNAMQKLD